MQVQTAVVLGASGFIGSKVVEELLNDPAFDKVRLLVRRLIEYNHPKVETALVDFTNQNDYRDKLGTGDCIFCCIGTTMKKVKGNRELYRKIDYEIPVNAAKYGISAGFKKYLLVSSVGADPGAKNFYLQLKGEVEKDIAAQSFETIHIFRPSILLGDRKEFRLGEIIVKGLMRVISFLLFGKFKKFRGIDGVNVAKAMINAAKCETKGIKVYEYDDIMKLSKNQLLK